MKQPIVNLFIAIVVLGLVACGTNSEGRISEDGIGHKDPGGMKAAAQKLGVSVEVLSDALGSPPPDIKAAAQKLGVSESQLNQALGRPPKGPDRERPAPGGPPPKGPNGERPAPGGPAPKGPDKGGKVGDRYACVINPNGYCIFTGRPHETGLKQGTGEVLDRDGNFLYSMNEAVAASSSGEILKAAGRPAFDGDDLIESSQDGMTSDEKAFHKVMAIMFPIRNALMYDIATVTQSEWEELVKDLAKRAIKETTYTDGVTPRDNYYGRQGVFVLAKNPEGKDIHHEVMRFLEEASIYLLCHVTSDEFNQMLKDRPSEGHDPCEDAKIITKMPF
ncbi:MAG TPA: hypothetical protein EYG27_01300 [Dehalococcoidia bacterium]|nr:hypothetical protein [Dehalococcoidia bacterium]